ncbi:dentin sialophosphoprotein [Octopus bimaculoides]|uniref:EF-hand domain-containing protein n=1 Tax=Octopus bimaculoides TaxID=37653 RepID=A0A0L8IEQ7_OCTBM|nr:dentin sialophosphoprotein [Octopus bimaculoides]XP_014771719.1 dentin sialophosphoprotein [Octopus bimaculoides]XP_014771728.1 dentin sialophosphoprotein [Octopus bimaculoides]XP_014771734.1 dentin sialophosphoprotein [Octopus bimaculoides]|eukprot:XP_014771710.1 PREDICTED: dentin sialophosphoprotein-like [Octopus bimaculoides]
MVKHHSGLVCFFCLIWICLSWQQPVKVPRFKRDHKAESVKIETIKDPKAVEQFLVNPKKDSEEFRPVPLPKNFSRYDNNINDNFISLQELIKTTGARRNAKEAFKDADKNGDGKISPEEFQGAPWTLNVSEILVNANISNINLTEILEEDPKQDENGSLKIGNALDSRQTEDKMNSFDIGMENSNDIQLEDSSENRLDDSSESQMENSSESQMEDSSESQMEDSFESQMEDSFERIFEESSESQIEDSFESHLKDSFENRLEDSFESQLKDNFESILEDSSESKLEDSSERKSDDTFESRLEDSLENILENKLVDSSDIKVEDSSDISEEDNSERLLEDSSENSVKDSSENSEEENPKSREIVDLNSDIQSWNSHHS